MAPSGGASFPASLVLVGAGKMGGALLQGWLDLGLDAARISVVEPEPGPELRALCTERGIALAWPQTPPEALVLAIKPQMLDAAAPQIAAHAGDATLVVSILAGKTIANVLSRLPQARAVVRAMPNLPAAIGRGMTGAVGNAAVTAAQRHCADALLSAVGQVEWLDDESLIDAVTAVSGSGPAYVFYLAECLAEAGRKAGLPADMAERLARATVEGAGALLEQRPENSAAALRESVTSRGGTTAAALEVLGSAGGLGELIEKAVLAARKRAEELSG
ncbi:MAG: pyrroline-5-carboxylate reductase [Beijerinckiaceae bacterium]|nr:MAG: pyrroline-5-carboxylate reductase [Beijerinckiaceae bacterium]